MGLIVQFAPGNAKGRRWEPAASGRSVDLVVRVLSRRSKPSQRPACPIHRSALADDGARICCGCGCLYARVAGERERGRCRRAQRNRSERGRHSHVPGGGCVHRVLFGRGRLLHRAPSLRVHGTLVSRVQVSPTESGDVKRFIANVRQIHDECVAVGQRSTGVSGRARRARRAESKSLRVAAATGVRRAACSMTTSSRSNASPTHAPASWQTSSPPR